MRNGIFFPCTAFILLGTGLAFCSARGYEIPDLDKIINNPNVDPGFARPTPGWRPWPSVWDRLFGVSPRMIMRGRSAYDIPDLEKILNNPNVDPGFSRPTGGWPRLPRPWRWPRPIPPSWLRVRGI